MAYRKVGHAFRSNARRLSMEKRTGKMAMIAINNQRRSNFASMANGAISCQLFSTPACNDNGHSVHINVAPSAMNAGMTNNEMMMGQRMSQLQGVPPLSSASNVPHAPKSPAKSLISGHSRV